MSFTVEKAVTANSLRIRTSGAKHRLPAQRMKRVFGVKRRACKQAVADKRTPLGGMTRSNETMCAMTFIKL